MPTYEYHCDACEHHFDEFQPITAEPLKMCPQCKKPKLRRVFGTGAAILFAVLVVPVAALMLRGGVAGVRQLGSDATRNEITRGGTARADFLKLTSVMTSTPLAMCTAADHSSIMRPAAS